MFFFAPPGRGVPLDDFRDLEVDQVLGQFDGPKTFTLRDVSGDLYFAHFCEDSRDLLRFFLVPFSPDLLTRLTTGVLSIRDALDQARFWVVDVRDVWQPTDAWRCSPKDVPADCMPERDVMLWPSLEPLLSLRTTGITIGEGTTPASVITDVIEGAKTAVRILVEHVRDLRTQMGRPTESRRRWYDLPTQRIQFASFEVAFRMPSDEPQLEFDNSESRQQVFSEVGSLLEKGLRWLLKDWPNEPEWKSDEERKAVLEAIESLIPSTFGPAHSIRVRGRLVSSMEERVGRIELTKNTKQAVKAALAKRAVRAEKIVDQFGYIRELDKDRYTFELRDKPDDWTTSLKFAFDESLAEDVNQAVYMDQFVEVVGVQTSQKRPILARIIRFVDETEQETGGEQDE